MRTIHVHALGPSGSGKTVFMAAMYRQLRIEREAASFYLETDFDTSLHMNTVFNAVASPSEDWPPGTRTLNEWEFGLTVTTPKGSFEALKMTYLDYPGLILTAPRAAADERFAGAIEKLKSAHALLVLLDGVGVRACLRGEPHGRRFLDFEVSSSLEIVQHTRCPVHFAVTKWDQLEGAHSLTEVRDLLMADDNFRDLIRNRFRSPSGPVRLIPVSSVGTGFAALQPSGQMQKLGRPPHPFQVELPLMSVIPDFFTHAYSELRAQDQMLINRIRPQVSGQGRFGKVQDLIFDKARLAQAREVARRFLTPRVARMLRSAHPTLAALLPDDPEQLIDELLLIVEEASRRAVAKSEGRRAADTAHIAELRDGVHDQISALHLIETQFREILDRFEQEHPESLLATPPVA